MEQPDTSTASPLAGHAAAPDTLAGRLAQQARACPQRTAFVLLDNDLGAARSLTFGELADAAAAIGQALLRRAQPGDPVLLAFNNGAEAVQAFWGCVVAGLIPVPAPAPDSTHSPAARARLAGIIADAEIRLALAASEMPAGEDPVVWCTVDALLGEPTGAATPLPAGRQEADSTAYLQYTSGSTSAPRGAEITHAAAIAQVDALTAVATVDPEHDRSLIWLPWFHDYGLVHALIAPVCKGFTSFVMPTLSFMRQPLRWLEAVGAYGITHTGAPNFAFAACLRALEREPGWLGQLDTLRVVSCGAEPVRHETLAGFAAAFAQHGLKQAALAPSYGLAEAVLAVSLSRSGTQTLQVDADELEQHRVVIAAADAVAVTQLVSCGEPLPGFELRIVEPESCRACAEDEVGEIWVSGPSLSRGYHGNPDATDEVFGACVAGEVNPMYLRTGDLGFLYRGELYVTGRRKDMLVVHGRNIYPQDIERSAEAAHERVREAGVIAVGAFCEDGQETVAVLVECRGRPEPEFVAELAEAVRRRVAADFGIDAPEVVLLRSASLPRTSSGKLQRASALRMFRSGELDARRLAARAAAPADEPVAVSSDVLGQVLAVWAQVLNVTVPAADDDFFARGGDSLLATQIVSRLNAQFGIELPVRAVFEAPAPQELARRVAAAQQAGVETPAQPVGGRAEKGAKRQLSFTQERMWFMHELAPESAAYNVPLALRLRGRIRRNVLQAAVDAVARRHETLRTAFAATSLGPYAIATAQPALPISEIDLQRPASSAAPELEATLTRLASEPFRLDQAPLIRLTLIRLADDDAILLIVMHHLIADQWSCAVFGRDLATAYCGAADAGAVNLPELPLQYADYAEWQRQWFSGERLQSQLSYWRSQLDGMEPLQLNEDFPRSVQQSFAGASVRRQLDDKRLAALRSLASASGASLSMVLIAALKVLLMRHTGKTDIAIGVPVANRHHLSSEELIGSFVNTLVFRTDLSGEPDFADTLRRVREVSLEAYTNQDLPFEVLVRELDLPHDISRSPLFDVMFNMINTPAGDIDFPELEWSRFDFDRGAAQFDLTVSVDAHFAPSIVFEYATALFARDTIERLVDHYVRIIDAVIADSAAAIADIGLLDQADRARLQQWGEGIPADTTRQQTVSDQVAAHATASPAATAVICAGQQRSYAELDAAANRLAAELRRQGVGRGHTIGICLPRSAALPEVLLGAIRSGAAYVPLDPAYPRERLLYQAEDAGIDLLIADEHTVRYLNAPGMRTLLIDRDADWIAAQPATPLPADSCCDATPDDPAYIIYTSGSTGVPKGVVVPHRAVVNFIDTMRQEPGLDASDRVLAVTTLGFDIAVLEILVPLAAGACAVIANDNEASDGAVLAQLLNEHDITLMQATPSRWQMLLAAGWSGKADLRALTGGEPLLPDLAEQLLDRCRALWNMYGPTETTVWSSCWRVPRRGLAPVSLGKPVAGTTLQVLDDHGQLCPVGVPGELCIGGRGLALGYHNQPAQTALRFITAGQRTAYPGSAIYRTGDRARWRRDGRLEHLGRLDDQFKLRGYRVEPGEIENHLLGHDDIEKALVRVHTDKSGTAQLVAYVVATDKHITADDLRAYLRQWVPQHMVPQSCIVLDEMPVLPNGKVDRRALPAPAPAVTTQSAADQPASATEFALMLVWQTVLEQQDFGVHDNFFDLGGHSVLAVNLVQTIARDLAFDCSLPMLFQYPTVASLAAALEADHAELENAAAARLLAPGDSTPLFCLSGLDLYRGLAETLPSGTRVYGLLSAAELALMTKGTRLPPLEDIATTYLETIRRLQPGGPYRLAGFSIGGVLAFDVACRLRDAGEEVECLALLDCAVPGFSAGHVLRWLRKRTLQLRGSGRDYLLGDDVGEPAESATFDQQEVMSVYPEFARVMRAYKARVWEGSLLFLQAADDPITEPGYGWRAHAPGLTVERIPGEHMDMLNGRSTGQVADSLQRLFDNVSAGSPAGTELRYSSYDESRPKR